MPEPRFLEVLLSLYERRETEQLRGAYQGAPPEASDALPTVDLTGSGVIPRREVILDPHTVRGFLSTTIAPGGGGKTTLLLLEAVAVATGRSLLGALPRERCRVLYLSGEDSGEEILRRIQAITHHFDLDAAEIAEGLTVISGRDEDLRLAAPGRAGPEVVRAVVDRLLGLIRRRNIGWVIFDPLKSFHRGLDENSNDVMEQLARIATSLAEETDCAVEYAHHSRKLNGRDAGRDDSRGGSALSDAARSVRTLRLMTDREAGSFGIESGARGTFVAVETVKSNLSRTGGLFWYRFVDVELPGGEFVQTLEPWSPPDPFADVSDDDARQIWDAVRSGRGAGQGWRYNVQTKEAWVGHAIGSVLGLDPGDRRDRIRIDHVLGMLLDDGLLKVVDRPRNGKGDLAPFVEATDDTSSEPVGERSQLCRH